MKKIKWATFLIFLFLSNLVFSQNIYPNINNDQIKNIKISYIAVFKDSIQNYPLFFPENANNNKRNLIETLMFGITEQNLPAFYNNFDDNFISNINIKDVKYNLGEIYDTIFSTSDANNIDTLTIHELYDPSEIFLYIIEEAWLYDFSDSLIDVRIVSISPVRKYYDADDIFLSDEKYVMCFTAKFIDFADLFKEQIIFKPNGDQDGNLFDFFKNRKYCGINYTKTKFPVYFHQKINSNIFANENSETVISNIPNVNYTYINSNPYISTDTTINLGWLYYPFNKVHFFSKFQYRMPNQYPQIHDTIYAAKLTYKHIFERDSVNTPLFKPPTTRIYTENYSNDTLISPYGYYSLFDFIINSIEYKKINAYQTSLSDFGNEYDCKLNLTEVYNRSGNYVNKSYPFINDGSSYYDTVYSFQKHTSREIKSYIFQELELYNAAGKIVQTRVIGICPIRKYYRYDDFELENPKYKKIFWINFKEFQPIAATQNIYKNNFDSSQTFDDFIFNQKYLGYDFTTKQAQLDTSSYSTDSIWIEMNYNHNFLNLYSNNKIINSLLSDIKIPKIQNYDYKKISKKDFSSAKIVYTQINASNDTTIFINDKRNLGFLSLINIIITEIKNDKLATYKTNKLKNNLSIAETFSILGEREITTEDWGGNIIKVKIKFSPDDITSYKLKELWLFDKQGDVIEKRIIAICPIIKYYSDNDYYQDNPINTETIWVNFAQLQPFLKQNYIPLLNFSSANTYNNYFINQKYKSNTIEEIKISKRKAYKILKQL